MKHIIYRDYKYKLYNILYKYKKGIYTDYKYKVG